MRSMILSGITTLVLAASAFGGEPSVQNDRYGIEAGRWEVEIVDGLALPDALRGRDVTLRVYHPAGDGVFPVIVFSHGLGGGRAAFGPISAHLASHGYVVLHPDHDDAGVGMTGGGMHPSEAKVRDRVRDVTAVLDALDDVEAAIPALAGKLDRENMGVAGHSYGSFVTMLTGGATIELGSESDVSLADGRVRCIMPVSPSGRGDYGFTDDSWNELTMPALFITGTDDVRQGRSEDWRLEPYALSPAGDKYLIIIDGANHGAFGGDGSRSNAPTYVKTAAVAFFDSCLGDSSNGSNYLKSSGFRDFAGRAATISVK